MKLNQQILQINRNFLICFVISASLSALFSQMLSNYDSFLNTTLTIIFGYIVYFGIFTSLFYLDNKKRYKNMSSKFIKKEIISLISSFGIGEIIYLGTRWPSLYYFLEVGIEPYQASLISEVIATALYMMSVTIFLRKTKTF